jgi:threonine dehydrogenase-like Zn-dependent dehydrogenase
MLTSKAAVFVEPNKPLEIREFPVQDPAPGGALIAMDMAAICGSDVHYSKMQGMPAPIIFGHENIGVLAKATKGINKDVLGERVKEGDRVIFRAAACGHCLGCALNENCDNIFQYGQMAISESPLITGGYSQYVHIPPGRPWLLRVPDDMSTDRALLSVIGNHTVYRGIQRMGGISLADTVVVQGSGPIGMGAVIQSKIGGAQRVILIGAPAQRLALGKEMGADETIDIAEYPDEKSRVAKILELTGGKGADVVIEAAGSKSAAREALQMARKAGKVLLVGSFYDYGEMTVNPTLLVRKALKVFGVAGSAAEGIIRSFQAMHTIVPYPVEKLITHRFPLEQVNEAFHVHETLEAMVAVLTPNKK